MKTKCSFIGTILLLLVSSQNLQAGGVTIVTHGWYSESINWLLPMRAAIESRASSKGSVAEEQWDVEDLDNPPYITSYLSDPGLASASSGELIICLDWSIFSTWNDLRVSDVAARIAEVLLDNTQVLEQPIHLIGHSRGAWLIGEIAGRLAQRNIWVDQVTFLDPAGIALDFLSDPRAEPYDNIVFADEYYQTLVEWRGEQLDWVSSTNLTTIFSTDLIIGNAHTKVHDWYHGTIDLDATTVVGRTIGRSLENGWYGAPPWGYQWGYQYGYRFSRIGDVANNYRNLGNNFYLEGLSSYHGGRAERSFDITRVGEQWPNIIIENLDSWSVQEGQQFLRIKTIFNTPASATITFLTDNDCNPYTAGTGREVTTISKSASQTYQTRDQFVYNWYPASVDNGKYLYAKITANGKTRYFYLPQTVNVTPAPQISLSGGSVSPSSGTTEGIYTYQATYYDSSGQTPSEKKVYIDGVSYDMSLVSGSAANGTYQYQKSGFSVGVHNYYYQFKAANGTIKRSPASGTLSGPTVNSQSTGDGRVRIEVHWGENTYGYDGQGGRVEPNISDSANFSAGETMWFAAYTNYGWMLDRWYIRYIWSLSPGADYYYDADATSGNSAMMITRDAERDANNFAWTAIFCKFKRIHEGNRILTISKIGPGNVSPSSGSYEYTLNATATLTATANSNGRFLKWRDANGVQISTSTVCQIQMTGDKAVLAIFQYNQTAIYTNDLPCIADANILVNEMQDNIGLGHPLVTFTFKTNFATPRLFEALMKFDLTTLPEDAVVFKLELHLWNTDLPGNNYGYEIQKNDSAWSEETITGSVPGRTSIEWLDDIEFPTENSWHDIQLSQIRVESLTWFSEWRAGANYGLRLRPHQGRIDDGDHYGGGWYDYASRHYSDTNKLPVLKVTYEGRKLIPAISVSPTEFGLDVTLGSSSSNLALAIHNSGEGTLNYRVTTNVAWLTLSGDTVSSSTGQTRQVTLTFSDAGLSLGTYNGTVTVTDNDSSNSNAPVQIPVAFTVLGPHIRTSTTNISMSAIYNINPINSVLTVWNSRYGTLNYTIATNAAWLAVAPSSGASTGEVDSINVNYNVTGLNTGVYSGTISVSDSVATNSPVTINVQLTVLPPIPNAPTDVSATDGSSTGNVQVTWNTTTWASGYEVWRSTIGNSNSAYKLNNDPSVTNYLDTTATPGTLYYYWVKAKNATGTSPMSGSNSGYRAISAPAGLVASDGTYTNKVRVTWNGSVGAEGYRTYRHTVNDSGAASPIGDVIGAGFNDTNAAPGTLYYYWVKATNAITSSDFSGVDTGYRMISAPITLNASDGVFTDKVQLAWNSSEGASTYSLWRNASNYSASATNIGISTTTNYNDSNTVAGATYYYWVKASNDVCQSAFSSPNYGHKAIVGAPVSPTNTVASDGIYSNMVLVNWSMVTNAAAYEVWRSSADDFSLATKISASDVSTNVFGDATAVPGTTYYYWMKAKNASGASGFGDPRDSGWRNMPPPDVVSATDGAYTSKVRVTWSAVDGATAYTVWRGTNSQSGLAVSIGGDVATTNYDDTTVENATLYYYWVKAKNAFLTSAFGMPDSGYSRLIPPSSVSASDGIFSDKVRVIWTRSAKASAYLIYRHTANDVNTAQILVVLPGTQTGANQAYYDDTSATPETTYYYWVKATNSVCDSNLSASDSGWKGVVPSVASQPQSQTKLPGDPVTFSITGAGSAPLSYRWQKRGVNIVGATASSYTIGRVAESDEGAYRCLVTNLCGSTLSAEANLTVIDVGTLVAPAQVRASDGTYTDKVRVTWNAVNGASFYEVWRSANNNTASASNLGTIATTTYDDLTAATTPGTILYYWVKARNSTAVSEFSYPDSGYCRPATPSGSADLSISSVLFDPVVIQQGQNPTLLMLMLANNGPDAMNNSPLNFAFYLSGNDMFGDGDDHWMGDYSANTTILVGGYTTVILSEAGLAGVTIPPVADGNYYVFAKAQHASTVTDPDENNNVCKRTGTIQIGTTAGLKIPVSGDFDGDGKTDLALYQEATGTWQVRLSGSEYGLLEVPGLGGSGLTTLAGDFDGDGKDDPAIYNEATGDWQVWKSRSGYMPVTLNHGGLGFKPVSGDYNGMLMADVAVYQEARGYWLIILSETTALSYYEFGADGYIPVTGDYDGDGKTDMALYERSSGNWHVKLSSAGGVEASLVGFGGPGYHPVIADYDGDGLADLGLYHETTGTWLVRLSAAGYALASLDGFGGSGYVPVPGDFDGDGLADLVIYETATSTWTFRLSSMGYAPRSVVF